MSHLALDALQMVAERRTRAPARERKELLDAISRTCRSARERTASLLVDMADSPLVSSVGREYVWACVWLVRRPWAAAAVARVADDVLGRLAEHTSESLAAVREVAERGGDADVCAVLEALQYCKMDRRAAVPYPSDSAIGRLWRDDGAAEEAGLRAATETARRRGWTALATRLHNYTAYLCARG